MKNFFSWGLKSLDYFSQPIQITFNQKRNFSTVLGGFLSLVIYCVTLTLVISSANNLLNKVNPKTTMTDSVFYEAPLLNVSEQNLIYTIAFLDRDFQPLYDDSLFTMEFSQFKRERLNDGNTITRYIPLNRTRCSMYKEEFKRRGFDKEYIANNIELGVCFDNQKPELILGGEFSSNYFSNINFRIKRCVNSSSSLTICKPTEIIDDKLLNGYFQFYYFGNNIDINNYTDPYKTSFSNYFIVVDPKASKFIEVNFKTVNISTDAGLIFQSNEYQSALVFDNYREQILVQVVNDLVIDFYINSSKNYLTYTRIYQKFQDFAANIGGLIKVMTVLGYFATINFTHYAMYEKMLNCLYKFNFKEESTQCKIQNTSENKIILKDKLNNLTNQKYLSNNQNFQNTNLSGFIKNNYLEADDNPKHLHQNFDFEKSINAINYESLNIHINREMENDNKKYKKKILLNPVNVIKLYLCHCCSRRSSTNLNLFNIAFKKLYKYLDYLRIIQTLQQFHKLKNVIFSKTQKKIFLLHSKPLICLNNKNKNYETKKSLIEGSNENKLNYDNYIKARKKEGSNKIYKRLLNNFDENLKNIFENIQN